MDVQFGETAIKFGERFSLTFQRTLRVPDDGKLYPLPPGLGRFPIVAAADIEASARASLPDTDAIISMHQDEALWLGFDGAGWKPNAVKVAAGGINVLTGEHDSGGLASNPQNYLVCPPQPWLDGINAGESRVRQFVAVPLGGGDTIEGQLSGHETTGGIQVTVYDPKPGLFPDTEPERPLTAATAARSMGLGAGGAITQRIYPDRYGVQTWDEVGATRVRVQILNTAQFESATGRKAPQTPITAATYTQYGFPWFALYDEDLGDIDASPRLKTVRSIRDRRTGRGEPSHEDEPGFDVKDEQVIHLRRQQPAPTHERGAGPDPT